MKKIIRAIMILGCFLGLASLLRIHAQQREDIIQTAVLQDRTGNAVKEVTSHQPQDLQMALTVKLPAGETMVTLADQDNAKFKIGDISDLQPEEDITARVDRQHHLLLRNDQDEMRKVAVIVPLEVTNPLLIASLQLELQVADSVETFTLPEVTVTADDTEEAVKESTKDSAKESVKASSKQRPADSAKDTQTKESIVKETTGEDTAKESVASSDQKASENKRQGSQTTGNSQSKEATTSSESVTKKAVSDEVAKVANSTQAKNVQRLATIKSALANEEIPVHRAQIQMESWSDELIMGGTILDKDVTLYEKKLGEDQNITVGGYYGGTNFNNFETRYHSSYLQKNGGEKAYAIALNGKPDLDETDTIEVYYPNVGAYTTSTTAETPTEQMGVLIQISNLKYHEKMEKANAGRAYFDFSNNFYSGMVYNGIYEFDIDMTFTNADGTKALRFPGKNAQDDYQTHFTFGSLNGNEPDQHEWAGTRSGLVGKLAPQALIKEHDKGWYEGIGIGVTPGEDHSGDQYWGDYLGSSDYELGAVSFPMVGTTQLFKLRSEFGFTWQSFSSGYIMPLEPAAPQKTVHRTNELGLGNNNLDGVTIDRDADDLNSFYYTIYQPTYSIPNESIAKPNEIIFRDRLPQGVTVTKENIQLFNTDGKLIDVGGGDITISEDGTVVYKLSDQEIEALTFDGKSFAIQLKVTLADDFVGTLKNRASIEFNSGDGHTWRKRTNRVVTRFFRGYPHEFQKIDGTTNKPLTGAEFIVRNAAGGYLTFDRSGKFEKVVTDRVAATRLTGDDTGKFRITGLPRGEYTLIETQAPEGYVIGSATKFTISDKIQSTPQQIKNDPYSLPVTGGQGIFWFMVIGLTLTLSSIVIWRTHPRGG